MRKDTGIINLWRKLAYRYPALSGIASYLPGKSIEKGPGGTSADPRYCYTVWMRHLVSSWKNGMDKIPDTVGELGPGGSLGAGICALLSGASTYYAFDAVAHTDPAENTGLLRDLAEMLGRREDIPGDGEFPATLPYLDSYAFPEHILTDELLEKTLNEKRVEQVSEALENPGKRCGEILISYVAPWKSSDGPGKESLDMLFSQAVMGLVDDISDSYALTFDWLKKGGLSSHVLEFASSRGKLMGRWNAHWCYSNAGWRCMKGKKPFIENRQPHSAHIESLEGCGFTLVCDEKKFLASAVKRDELSRAFRKISDEDLKTKSAFVQAVKKP